MVEASAPNKIVRLSTAFCGGPAAAFHGGTADQTAGVRIDYGWTLYKQRHDIKRMFGQLNINRAIPIRYDPTANDVLGMATIRYWLTFAPTAQPPYSLTRTDANLE